MTTQLPISKQSGTEKNILQVFVIRENKNNGYFDIVSNRQLVWKWIQENKYGCLLNTKATPPRMLKSYDALCHAWQSNPVMDVLIIEPGNEPVAYQLIRMPVKRK
jgi:hypothetical protein